MAQKNRTSGNLLYRQIKAHARLLIAIAVGTLAWAFARSGTGAVTGLLIGWNAGIWLFLLLALQMMYGATPDDIRRRAGIEEEGRGVILGLVVAASVATFVAIGSELSEAKSAPGAARVFHVSLALATIFGSWLFMNFAFAVHYAHEFQTLNQNAKSKPILEFPGGEKPDYWDFLYFAMVIGTTFQTSDVEIHSRQFRRTVLIQGLIAFLFNTAVIALTVNIAAQFFGGGN
jgi:uncharacterized membrane protein